MITFFYLLVLNFLYVSEKSIIFGERERKREKENENENENEKGKWRDGEKVVENIHNPILDLSANYVSHLPTPCLRIHLRRLFINLI